MAKKTGSPAVSTKALKALRLIGILMLAHSFYVAIASKYSLKAHLHNVDGQDLAVDSSREGNEQGHGLPYYCLVETLVGAVIIVLAQAFLALNSLSLIRRKQVAGTCGRYDHATFSGMDFASFNHRGAQSSAE
eukprot:GILI01024958.1.p1 GENE.GILI01024958.1~~GILI01024958.1.p1  ORF type:complete len:133 (-),score=6.21 GILI01024958.1:35-433(-)